MAESYHDARRHEALRLAWAGAQDQIAALSPEDQARLSAALDAVVMGEATPDVPERLAGPLQDMSGALARAGITIGQAPGSAPFAAPAPMGRWDTPDGAAPADGSGRFIFAPPVTLADGREITEVTYAEGYPQIDAYVQGGRHGLAAITTLPSRDAAELARAMAGKPNWRPPSPAQVSLHYFADGSVGYIPKPLSRRLPVLFRDRLIANALF